MGDWHAIRDETYGPRQWFEVRHDSPEETAVRLVRVRDDGQADYTVTRITGEFATDRDALREARAFIQEMVTRG